MDPATDGRPGPVVRHLMKLPVIDRVKLVKDMVLHQLDAIHAAVVQAGQRVEDLDLTRQQVDAIHGAVVQAGQRVEGLDLTRQQVAGIHGAVMAVHEVVNALLANDSALIESSSSLVDAMRDTRLAVDRHGQLLLDTLRQSRQDALRQAQELLHTLRSGREETKQQEHLVLEALSAGQQKDELQAERLFGAIQASRRETREQTQALLDDVRQAQREAQRQARELLNLVQSSREELREQTQALLDDVRQARHDAQRQGQELLSLVRSSREDGREQETLLFGALSAGQQRDERQGEGLLGAVEAGREETRDQAQTLLDDVRQARQDAQRQAQELLDTMQGTHTATQNKADLLLELLRRTDGAIREQSNLLLDAIGEGNRGVAERGSQIETALDKLQALATAERRLLHDTIERTRVYIQPTEVPQSKAILLRDACGEEPEVGLMVHLYSYVPGRAAIDIGANVGDVSHRLLGAGYEVFAFEPHSEVFRLLSDRLGRDPAFHGFPWALGPGDETKQLHIAADRSGTNRYRDSTLYSSLLSHSMPDDLPFTHTVPVTVRSLESLHASGHVPPEVGLVKIDTEGFDREVIRGMGAHRYPVVVAEYWDPAIPFGESGALNRLDDMVGDMRARGYFWYIVFYRIWGKEEISFYCNHDASIAHAYGNVFFFQDHAVFSQALLWSSAVLPITYIGR